MKKLIVMALACTMIASLASCNNADSKKTENINTKSTTDTEINDTNSYDPYGKYENQITVTMGRQTTQNPKMPNGDTYENNAYTRWVTSELNVKIKDAFEANGVDYSRQVSLGLSSGDLPDIFRVDTRDELRELYENDLIADLTEVYNNYASDGLKSKYDSYDGRAIEQVSFEDKIFALPSTVRDSGPGEAWIRTDWAEKIGLVIDEDGDLCLTLDELVNIAKEFKEKNPSGADKSVGMAFLPNLTGPLADDTMAINYISYAMGAYPKQWLNVDGQIVWGSTQPKMKEALKYINKLFSDGIIDEQLGTRTWDDISSLLVNGQLGIVNGPWHIPDWLLNNVRSLDNNAIFTPFAIKDADGKIWAAHKNATGGYIVVNKNFKNPEIAIKIANMFYDKLENNGAEVAAAYPEVGQYQKDGVDGTTRPFNIEVNSSTSLLDDYKEIEEYVNGTITLEQVRTTEGKNVGESAKLYLADPSSVDVPTWSKYLSRMKGIELIQTLIEKDSINWISPIYPENTPTMKTNQANLDKLEEETFIKIVTGAVDADSAFDSFVSEWKSSGGEKISTEILEQQK